MTTRLWGASCVVLNIFLFCSVKATHWQQWWEYEGLSGPLYWGFINPEWTLCKHGRQQSPINIHPSRLLYDPNLKHLQLDSTPMKGMIRNTGNDITVDLQGDRYSSVNISQGPLSYRYRAVQIKFHFSSSDDAGSEHLIAGRAFPVELNMVCGHRYKQYRKRSKGKFRWVPRTRFSPSLS